MTKADEMNITNLMENVRKMEAATAANRNAEEIAKIRQYCIDAVRDYNDTNKRLCDLINANRDLWKKPYIIGSRDGFVNGKPYHLGEHDFWHCHCPFTFNRGYFSIGDGVNVIVSGISGDKQRTGYCGIFEDHNLITKDWKAESIEVEDDYCGQRPWYRDLITDYFELRSADRYSKEHYTEENLRKYNWNIEQWVSLKEKAVRTRKRTEALVKCIKDSLERRIKDSTEKLNKLTSSSETSVYVKVQF